GVPDVLCSEAASILVFTGHGDLGFTKDPQAIDSVAVPAQLLPLDLDGDGDTDLVAGNHDGVRVTVHLNAGQGVFAPHAEYGAIPEGFVVAAGDWDLDGDPDLVFGEFDGDGLDLLFNHGDGSFGSAVPIVIPSPIGAVAAGDLDGDGDPDIAATA